MALLARGFCVVIKNKILFFRLGAVIKRFSLENLIILDIKRSMFFFSVNIIAFAVIGFSKSYMRREVYKLRFSLLVLFFLVCMYFIIFSARILFLIVGWDGLGLSSYLLVIYFFSSKSSNAGILTVLTNRLGDILIICSISLRWTLFDLLSTEALSGTSKIAGIGGAFLIIASFTKSAQTPFRAWLPAAIAAPTPVSSLVHSSTLVTAGVYLIIRYRGVIYSNSIILVGTLTICLAGFAALFENDIKKVVALSTLRQLGIIIWGLGIGLLELVFWHLLVHAYFKALLFLRVGNMIHLSDDYQDLRKINIFDGNTSLIFSLRLFANLSLTGFPFLTGFYSKDALIEAIFFDVGYSSSVFYLFLINCVMTATYTLRFIYYTFINSKRRKPIIKKFLEDFSFFYRALFLWGLALFLGFTSSYILICTPLSFSIPLSVKLRVTLILFWGLIIWKIVFINFKKLSFFSWNLGLIWSLPLFSSKFIKPFSINIFFIRWGFDSHFIPSVSQKRVGATYVESFPSPENYFKSFFFILILMLFFLFV